MGGIMGVIMEGGWGRYQVQELKYAMLSHVLEVRHRVLPFYCICSTSPVGCQCVCVCVCVCALPMKHHSKRLALTALTYIAALNAQHMSLNNHHSKHSINRTRQNTTEHDGTRERDNGWFIKAEAQVHQS